MGEIQKNEVLPKMEKQSEVKQPELLNIETQIDETIGSIKNGTQNVEENMSGVIDGLQTLKTQYGDNPDIQAKLNDHIQKLSEVSNIFIKESRGGIDNLIKSLEEIA